MNEVNPNTPASEQRRCGRFAPSPTGPLHFGSLIAATGSFLNAKAAGGEWRVRIEDIDPPREVEGAADDILRTLEIYGFEWDGEILYQSRRRDAHEAALAILRRGNALYPCCCTRKEIADSSVPGIEGAVYPGTCRAGLAQHQAARAWRVHTGNVTIEFTDRVQGARSSALERDIGDFVVQRADGLYAYQLACVVDDAGQGITEVVRGADLLASTARQIHLQRLLGLPAPVYTHLPAAVNAQGEKLSKQTFAEPLPRTRPVEVLWRALAFLGQDPPRAWQEARLDEFWQVARQHWKVEAIPKCVAIAV